MKLTWHYCEGGQNLPELNKGKVCVFKRGPRKSLEVCVLIEDLYEPNRKYWVVKGSGDRKEVFPFCWLEIDTDFPVEFFTNLERLGKLEVNI